MKYSQLFTLLHEVHLSPEQAASYFGFSGMTIRRWKKLPPEDTISKFYEKAIINGFHRLMQEGHLSASSKVVQHILQDENVLLFEGVMKQMGVTPGFLEQVKDSGKNPQQEGAILSGLTQIGLDKAKMEEVAQSEKKILSFKRMSHEWASRIETLLKVIKSKKISGVDKFVAYGALFYLIYPLDLIPDYLPAFGYLDDFAIMGFATAFYIKRFQKYLIK